MGRSDATLNFPPERRNPPPYGGDGKPMGNAQPAAWSAPSSTCGVDALKRLSPFQIAGSDLADFRLKEWPGARDRELRDQLSLSVWEFDSKVIHSLRHRRVRSRAVHRGRRARIF